MEPVSVLESLGAEITAIVTPVSACMLLVLLMVRGLTPNGSPESGPAIGALIYHERSTDSDVQKFEGGLLNAVVFIVSITIVTFILVGCFWLRCTRLIWGYMAFSAFTILAWLGGSVAVQIIQALSIPIDIITFSIILYNFSIVGVLAVFFCRVPVLLTQSYLVIIGAVVAFWFTHLPEWTTWLLLLAMAVYDLIAVLMPGGPLKLLVELAIERDEEIPALIYEARPLHGRGAQHSRYVEQPFASSPPSSPRHGGRLERRQRSRGTNRPTFPIRRGGGEGVALHSSVGDDEQGSLLSQGEQGAEIGSQERGQVGSGREAEKLRQDRGGSGLSSLDIEARHVRAETHNSEGRLEAGSSSSAVDEEAIPLVGAMEELRQVEAHQLEVGTESVVFDMSDAVTERSGNRETGPEIAAREFGLPDSIKLGLGDFIFYSVLVGRAAMYDLMTVYACYLAIIAGLGATLLLLALYRKALPALPISITLGVVFYLLTRLIMDPFVVGLATRMVFL